MYLWLLWKTVPINFSFSKQTVISFHFLKCSLTQDVFEIQPKKHTVLGLQNLYSILCLSFEHKNLKT